MSTDQIIRETAYAMWEADGRPDGRSEEFWLRAEKAVQETAIVSSIAEPTPKKKAKAKPVVTAGGN